MGITLGNRIQTVDMGYGDFSFGLRADIAKSIDSRLGKEYIKWLEAGVKHEEYDCSYLNQLLEDINLDDEVAEFLFEASDCEGSISPKCCKEILKTFVMIQRKNYGYVTPKGNTASYEDIRNILVDCVKHRWKLKWY